MNVNKCLHALLLSALCVIADVPGASGTESSVSTPASSFGTIVGIVTDAAKRPIAGATVTAVRAGGGIRSTISGSDGVYSFADVPLGAWSLTATIEGYPDVAGPIISVVANKATRHDVVMNIPAQGTAAPALAS